MSTPLEKYMNSCRPKTNSLYNYFCEMRIGSFRPKGKIKRTTIVKKQMYLQQRLQDRVQELKTRLSLRQLFLIAIKKRIPSYINGLISQLARIQEFLIMIWLQR